MGKVFVMDHPLIQHKITLLRDENTGGKQFRELVTEITQLIAYEATRDLPLEDKEIVTPVSPAVCKVLSGKKLVVVPILRAGLGMLDGFLSLVPSAKVGHIGLKRDEETLLPHEYYCNLPQDIDSRQVVIIDPMLATGGSAAATVAALKSRGAKDIKLMSIIASVQGIDALSKAHPDLDIYCGIVDKTLNEHGYIVPGLGDAGDRLFGTL
ncbi:MAG: uracil phosphoribosyltransferase [Clostridiales bacterium]|nr:uracil phosphoribosyltransferase [Clostridiales bacterium]